MANLCIKIKLIFLLSTGNRWKISTILDVLESLSHIKNIIFEDSDKHEWAPVEFSLCDHFESIDNTKRIFKTALEIIQNKFSKDSGSFKIVDPKYGFVIFKEKMQPPKMYNQEEINNCIVQEIVHDKDKGTFSLKLVPNSDSLESSSNELVLPEKLVKKLYFDFIKE